MFNLSNYDPVFGTWGGAGGTVMQNGGNQQAFPERGGLAALMRTGGQTAPMAASQPHASTQTAPMMSQYGHTGGVAQPMTMPTMRMGGPSQSFGSSLGQMWQQEQHPQWMWR